MIIKDIVWTEACCAWHGKYAEVNLSAGGAARLKISTDGKYSLLRYDSFGSRVDDDYISITEDELQSII